MGGVDRRTILAGAAVIAGVAASTSAFAAAAAPFRPLVGPRTRVLFVNDLSGDVDGLFAAAHQILSPSAELRGIVGTATGDAGETAERSVDLAKELMALMDRRGACPVHAGSNRRLADRAAPLRSAGAEAIVAEAMRSDSALPLYVAVGGGLTEVASAVLIEPRIVNRMTLVWIGGDATPQPRADETNFHIDPLAAHVLFNETTVPIWQVSREAYRTCSVSASELQAQIGRCGRIGPWLMDRLFDVTRKYDNRLNTGETWTLGDNPLTLLTALTGWSPSNRAVPLRFERTDSSLYDDLDGARIDASGVVAAQPQKRNIRVYRTVDNRMLFGDFFAKMRMHFET